MGINIEISRKFFILLQSLSKQLAIQAHDYLATHERIRGYCKYPIQERLFPKDNPQFEELYEIIPALRYGIPEYRLKDFPDDRIQYGAIFNGYATDRLDCSKLKEFDDLIEYVNSESELKKLFAKDANTNTLKYKLKEMASGIVERYMYSSNASDIVPDNLEGLLHPFVLEKVHRYFSDTLEIDIYIPICLATFEDDRIKLTEHIEIIRIPEDVQKSRQQACEYQSYKENLAASCATHMLVLHNYSLKNSEELSINEVTKNFHAYPLHIINNVMGALRVVTGFTVGYAQILCRPINWIDSFCADLVPLYGAKACFINPKEVEKPWGHLPVSYINKESTQEIQKIYKIIHDAEGDNKKNSLIFALKRFNRCVLRTEDDDIATDATIGLEALLAGGTKSEITYTISNRIPIVFAHESNEDYLPTNCRKIMKKIYDYRSKIVHGATLKDKHRYYEICDKKVEIEKIAVDFLRYTLLFILRNPEFLDATKFDEYIDVIISKASKNNETP